MSDNEIQELALSRLDMMQKMYREPEFIAQIGLTEQNASEKCEQFYAEMQQALETWDESHPLITGLKEAYLDADDGGIDSQFKYLLQGLVANEAFSEQDIINQVKFADLRYPYEWYPVTRALQRKLHLHIGPTNSGKTYHALKRLEAASSGIYAGPLRLLAHEVYTRLNARGKKCNLVTGDEMIFADGVDDPSEPIMNSCTVEMVPYSQRVDVAVIDEIQMIGDERRGWAWTQAVLGTRAKEVHMCGEERALPLIRELAAATGEELIIHRYERLSPLKTARTSLQGGLKNLRSGDCVVSFTRRGIHALKEKIERVTRKKVAVVYGALPPEVRAQQARLFNEGKEVDILVASDAIGMGLNLQVTTSSRLFHVLTNDRNIHRIVFESIIKYDGTGFNPLSVPQVKQIAGRAGRYRTAAQATEDDNDNETGQVGKPRPTSTLGLVTTLEGADLPYVLKAMNDEAEPIKSAGIFPPDHYVLRFASYFPPRTPFSYIMMRLHEIARIHPRFHLCLLRDQIKIADTIQHVEGLSIPERLTLCASPADPREASTNRALVAFAECIARQSGGQLLDIDAIDLEILDYQGKRNSTYLQSLEATHKAVVTYLWLSYRFPNIFPSQAMAFHVKHLLQEKIDEMLAHHARSQWQEERLRKKRKAAIRDIMTEDAPEGRGEAPEPSQQVTKSMPLATEAAASGEIPLRVPPPKYPESLEQSREHEIVSL